MLFLNLYEEKRPKEGQMTGMLVALFVVIILVAVVPYRDEIVAELHTKWREWRLVLISVRMFEQSDAAVYFVRKKDADRAKQCARRAATLYRVRAGYSPELSSDEFDDEHTTLYAGSQVN